MRFKRLLIVGRYLYHRHAKRRTEKHGGRTEGNTTTDTGGDCYQCRPLFVLLSFQSRIKTFRSIFFRRSESPFCAFSVKKIALFLQGRRAKHLLTVLGVLITTVEL